MQVKIIKQSMNTVHGHHVHHFSEGEVVEVSDDLGEFLIAEGKAEAVANGVVENHSDE